MTGWHLDDDTLRRYVERADSLAEGASVEQHLLSCDPCRVRVNAVASAPELSVIDLAMVWDRTRDAIEVPQPSFFERVLRATSRASWAGRPATRSSRSSTEGRGTSTASRVRSHTAAKSITLSSIGLAAALTRARHGSQDSRCCSAEAPSASESVRST